MIQPRRFPIPALLRCLISAAGLFPWVLLLAGPGALWLQPAFHPFCHQMPGRTLTLGVPMLVCSRCAGLYLGVAMGALIPAPAWNARVWRRLVLLASTFMTLDVVTQDLGMHPPIHLLRLSTGLALGWVASAFLFATLKQEVRESSDQGEVERNVGS